MPCYDSRDHVGHQQDELNELGNLLCEACRALEAAGLMKAQSKSLKRWWKEHKLRDEREGKT